MIKTLRMLLLAVGIASTFILSPHLTAQVATEAMMPVEGMERAGTLAPTDK